MNTAATGPVIVARTTAHVSTFMVMTSYCHANSVAPFRVQSQPLGKWSVVLDGGQLTICENQCFPHAAGASDKVRMHVGSPHRSRQATCPVGSAPAAELDR